jgi:hypothetical protein
VEREERKSPLPGAPEELARAEGAGAPPVGAECRLGYRGGYACLDVFSGELRVNYINSLISLG